MPKRELSSETVRIVLPAAAASFFPVERFSLVARALAKEVESLAARVRQHVQAMPAAAFATDPRWMEAQWSATTSKWHPTSEAPPIMGLVFDNAEAGKQIFREAQGQMNNEDRFEEMRPRWCCLSLSRRRRDSHGPTAKTRILASLSTLSGGQ